MNIYNNDSWKCIPILTIFLSLMLMILLPLGSGQARAQGIQPPKWSISAMACVPNGATTQNNMVQTSHGNARYTSGKTGDIYLICPFTDTSLHGLKVTTIEMTYQSSRNIQVSAVLRKVDKRSGDITNPLGVTSGNPCLINSTQLGDKYLTCGQTSSPHTLDFNKYYYYVQISLHRDNSAEEVRIVGVTIN